MIRFPVSGWYPELAEQVERAQKELRRDMDAAGHRRLLRLLDAQNALLAESKLMRFTAGFKLAWGMAKEGRWVLLLRAGGRRTHLPSDGTSGCLIQIHVEYTEATQICDTLSGECLIEECTENNVLLCYETMAEYKRKGVLI